MGKRGKKKQKQKTTQRIKHRETCESMKRQLAINEGVLASTLQERNKVHSWTRDHDAEDVVLSYNERPVTKVLDDLATRIRKLNEEIRALKERIKHC